MLINLSKEQIGNLMAFLDRVEVKGFKEIGAISDIVQALQNPVDDTVKSPHKEKD